MKLYVNPNHDRLEEIHNTKNDTLLTAYAVIMSVLGFIATNSNSGLITALFYIIPVIFVVFSDKSNVYPIITISFMLCLWVPYLYITIIMGLVTVLVFRKKVMINAQSIMFFIIALFGIYSLFDPSSSFEYFIKIAVSELVAVMLFTSDDKHYSSGIVKAYIIGYICMVILTLVISLKYIGFEYILSHRLGYTNISPYMPLNIQIPNENLLAIFSVICVACCMILSSNNQRLFSSKLFNIVVIAFALFIGLLTRSRTFVFGIAIFLVILFVQRRASLTKTIKFIFVLIVLLLFAYLIVTTFFPSVLSSYIIRFDVSDLSNQRNMIFDDLNDLFFKKDFGWVVFGTGGIKNIPSWLGYSTHSIHNSFQRAYFMHGVLGFALMIVAFIVSLRQIKRKGKNGKIGIIFYAPFILILAASYGLTCDFMMYIICVSMIEAGINHNAIYEQT